MLKIICEECKKEISEKTKICPNCGYKIKKNKICKSCFHRNVKGAMICTNCKMPLNGNTINIKLLTIFSCIIIIFILGFLYFDSAHNNNNNTNYINDNDTTSSERDTTKNNSNSNSSKYGKPTNSEAKFMAERICKSYLKSPSSAKWGKSVNVTSLGNDKYSVNGTVEAQNSYGAMISATYFAYFTFTGSGYKDAYCSIMNN